MTEATTAKITTAPKSVTLKTPVGGFQQEESRERGERGERGDRKAPKLFGRPFFQRRKACPFSSETAPAIDYKDTRLLGRYISEYGKIIPRHVTGVSAKKQRKLAQAIKRARILALLPYSSR